MKKLTAVLFAASVAFFMACGGGQQVQTAAPSSDIWVQTSNAQLAQIPVEGFGYKSSNVPATNWDKWAAASAPVVQKVIGGLPEGYVLQVTGHADARGPEYPEGNKPGNIKISEERAKAVHSALKKKGIDSPKFTYKGAGSSEPLEGVDPRDPKQRRVTFVVVPQ